MKIESGLAGFFFLFLLFSLAVGTTNPVHGQVVTNWAFSATASSEYSSPYWGAVQATGAPDTQGCGDATTAWCPRNSSGSAWLQVTFDKPRQAVGIQVHETLNAPFVSQLDLIDSDGVFHTVWSGKDGTTCPSGWLVVTFPKTAYIVAQAKVYTSATSWLEIDAVGLLTPSTGGTVPQILNQPRSQTVMEGNDAVFSVVASGTGPLSYAWSCNGQPVPAATSLSYTKRSAALADSNAQFTCLVSNELGMVMSRPATLRVEPSGVDHFTWGATSVQTTNTPFGATLTARDANGQIVSNFTGTVSLSGTAGGTALFADGFEAGNINAWHDEGGGYTLTTGYDTAGVGERSLTLIGGDQNQLDGLSHSFTNLTPALVNFHVRTSSSSVASGYFILGQGKYRTNSVAYFLMYTNGTMGLMLPDGSGFSQPVPYVPYQWYKISLALDWSAKTVDYYVDDVLIKAGTPFCRSAIQNITMLSLCNFDDTQTWWDQIEFLQGPSNGPGIDPFTSGSFVNGVWTGSFTVKQTVTNLTLRADDGLRHFGSSNPFHVVPPQVLPSMLAARHLNQGLFQLSFSGTVGWNYEIQSSTNLQDWNSCSITSTTNVNCLYEEAIQNSLRRFFRVRPSL